MGKSVGAFDGSCDGRRVGDEEGAEGENAFVHDGATVGAPVGPRDVPRIGSTEGAGEGDVDEKTDGAEEASRECEFDNTDEGTMLLSGTVDGFLDGALEGFGVVISDGSLDRVNAGIPDP